MTKQQKFLQKIKRKLKFKFDSLMVKQMSSNQDNSHTRNHQNNSRQTSRLIQQFPDSESNLESKILQPRQETFNFLNQSENSKKASILQNEQSSHLQLENNQKPEKSYRIISYPIQNKKYRLFSLNQDEDDQDSMNDIEDPNLENEFRQPIPFLPRFNPFARWNNRNQAHERRRFLLGNSRRFNQFRNRKSSFQSFVNYAKKVYTYLRSTKLSSWFEYVPFYPHSPTLQSKYRHISLAILNNSINLEAAVIKALEYNIPLMQIVMNPKNFTEEETVVEKILKDFTIAHFINQNFVLFGDWSHFERYREVFEKNLVQEENQQVLDKENIHQHNEKSQGGKIVFRKGEIVFAEIELSYVERIDHNELQQKLEEIRNHYYRQKQLYRNQESLISEKSIHNPSSVSEESSSKGSPQKQKTVKEIEDQILKDYLEQKMEEELVGRENMYYGQQSDSQMEFEEQQYPEDGNSYSRSESKYNSQFKQNKYENYDAEDLNQEDMIESRKLQQSQQNSEEEV